MRVVRTRRGGASLRLWSAALLAAMLVDALALASRETSGGRSSADPGADKGPAKKEVASLLGRGELKEAESEARSILGKLRAEGGESTLAYAEVLDLLVKVSWQEGKASDPQTRSMADEALAIKRERLGEDSGEFAESLSNLAVILEMTGHATEAKPLYERVVSIREHVYGATSIEVAKGLANLGTCLGVVGESRARLETLERARSVMESVVPADDPQLALLLGNLGISYVDEGDVQRARELFERSVAIYEKAYGPDSPALIIQLANLGNTLSVADDNAAARRYTLRALEISRRTLGPHSLQVAECLGNLGVQEIELGDYDQARRHLEEAIRLHKKLGDPTNPQMLSAQSSLAHVFLLLGETDRAKRLYEEDLAANRRTRGDRSPFVASSLISLGVVYLERGDPRSIGVLEEALSILRASFDEESPWTASAETNLGQALSVAGREQEALDIYDASLRHLEKSLGPTHMWIAECLTRRAISEWVLGRKLDAFRDSIRAEQVSRRRFQETARSLSEREALRYEEHRSQGLDQALSLMISGWSAPEAVSDLWSELIRSRAIVLDEMAMRHRAILSAPGSSLETRQRALERASRRLARLLAMDFREAGQGIAGKIEAAREERDVAERDLAEASLEFRRAVDGRRTRLEEIAAALPDGGATVAYVRYERLLLSHRSARRSRGALSPAFSRREEYAAFVLVRGGEPTIVSLGPATAIEGAIEEWKRLVSSAVPVLPSAAAQAELSCRRAGERLRRLLWDPVADRIAGASSLFIVPDGAVNLVSFAALPTPGGGWLLEEKPVLHYLSAERDLVVGPARRGRGILLVGSPDFDAGGLPGGSSRPAVGEEPDAAQTIPPAHRSDDREDGNAPCRGLAPGGFAPLPRSALEVDEIAALWGGRAGGPGEPDDAALVLKGREATKEAVMRLAVGRRFVHFATHGFLADRCAAASGRSTARSKARSEPARFDGVEVDPLLLTGLALAGVNRRREHGGSEDEGLLTAEEIAGLDLSSVEWAVLSACESGLGTIRDGEGVLGLRRAFQIAGTGTLVMSLWKVQDESAREWMRELYRARLRGQGSAASIRAASLEVLAARRRDGRSTHPSFWGAFIGSGDWR